MSGSAVRAVGTVLATVATTLWVGLGTFVLAWVGLAATAVAGARGFLPLARFWSRIWLLVAGVRLESRVAAEIDPGTRYVYMANHASKLDIPVLLVSLPTPTRFLAKRSLFQIPVFGWSLRAAGFVDIDREDRSKAQASFSQSMRRMAGGFSLLVFPEGTRSADGALLAFQRGGFLLALKSGQAIVPVGIRGTARLHPKGSLIYRPGRVDVVFGEPIEVADFGVRGRKRLMAVVRERIAELAEVEPAGE